MKKRHSIRILLAAAALLLATAACTKDELADGDRLPEGQYPLEIAAVTLSVEGGEAQPWGAPQTRVSENADGTGSVWEWDGSEMIGVQLGDKTTTYTLNTDHTLLADRQLYWTSTAPNQPVTAWYPATDGRNGRPPDPGHADLHPLVGKGARDAHGRCTRRSAKPPALCLHTVYL